MSRVAVSNYGIVGRKCGQHPRRSNRVVVGSSKGKPTAIDRCQVVVLCENQSLEVNTGADDLLDVVERIESHEAETS